MITDPVGLAEDVERATERLRASVATLDDAAVAEPSGLPDWTRGHVLTHLARNADGGVNLLTWARTGVQTPQYASLEQRAADIEAGAPRWLAEQVADLAAACERFSMAVAQMPAAAWTAEVRWTSGRSAPAARVVWSRLREVEIHHVDLAAGYSTADWPESFTLRVLRESVKDFGSRPDGPRGVLRAPEIGHDLMLGEGSTTPVISGPAWAAAGWLIGRGGADELRLDPPGALPAVPPLG